MKNRENMSRSQRHRNFIDKKVTLMADIFSKKIPSKKTSGLFSAVEMECHHNLKDVLKHSKITIYTKHCNFKQEYMNKSSLTELHDEVRMCGFKLPYVMKHSNPRQ